jgi:hypothetical protein
MNDTPTATGERAERKVPIGASFEGWRFTRVFSSFFPAPRSGGFKFTRGYARVPEDLPAACHCPNQGVSK